MGRGLAALRRWVAFAALLDYRGAVMRAAPPWDSPVFQWKFTAHPRAESQAGLWAFEHEVVVVYANHGSR